MSEIREGAVRMEGKGGMGKSKTALEEQMPICPHCGQDPVVIHMRYPYIFEAGDKEFKVAALSCANPICRKTLTTQIVEINDIE